MLQKCFTGENSKEFVRENLFANLTDEQKKRLEIWSMDFTEQKIRGKKIYTCAAISVKRKILVGYAQGEHCTAELAMEAFANAALEHGLPDMVMTDRGVQFVSRDFHAMLEDWGVRHSMSRPHKPADNCFIETFWKLMKVELGQTEHLTEEMYRMVVDYYVYYYNHVRPHSSLGYHPPLVA